MEESNCPKCGKALPANAPKGLCPACLIQAGLASATVSSVTSQAEARETRTINPVAGMRVRYFGDYELIEEIARGGMGVVWKARQTSLNRTVALKMILSGELASEREMERFRREAEAAANLQHPNIVAIHEIGERDGQHYFSMDYVDGRNLNSLAGGKPLPPQRAAGYMKIIAEAIHFAHQRGTLHRDLKPQNVLIDKQDQPRITDFGLAKVMGQNSGLTESGTVMGSPSYMPPEQATGRLDLIGPHSDVYSMGAILYELLTGRPPFQATTAMATLRQVVDENPVAPRKINPSVPPDLETICLKCLEKSPQMRYASARDLAADLERYLKEEPIHARPVAASRKVEQWFKAHPMFLAGTAALLLLALSSVAYGLWQQNQYLVWHAGHAQVERAAGPRTELVKTLDMVSSFLVVAIMFIFIFSNKQIRGIPLSKMFDSHWLTARPKEPISASTLRAYEMVSAICLVFAFYYLAKLINAYVWEAYAGQVAWGSIYALMYFSSAILLHARRERRAQLFGRDAGAVDAAQVPPDLAKNVFALLKDGLPAPAIKLYRTTTGCNLTDARTAVDNIAKQNGMRGIPPAKISVVKLLRNLVVSAASLGVLLYLFTPEWRLPLLLQFSGGWFFMVLIMFGLHLTGFGKRFLLTVPGMGYYLVTMELQKSYFPEQPAYWMSFVGMIAGAMMVMLAHETKRKVS